MAMFLLSVAVFSVLGYDISVKECCYVFGKIYLCGL